MKRYNLLKVFFLLLFSLLSCISGTNPEKDKNVIAIVGSFAITKDDLNDEVKDFEENDNDPQFWSSIFESLIEKTLILNEFLKNDKKVVTLKEFGGKSKIDSAVSIILESEVYSKVDVSRKEVEEYYKNNLAQFTKGEGFLVRQITTQGKQLKDEAVNLLKKGYSFEDVAVLYSISPDKGKLQYFEKSEIPEYLLPYLEIMKKGEFSHPIEISEDTYQIIKVEGIEKSYILPIEMVKDLIRVQISDEKGEKLKREFINSLKKRYNIKLFKERLWFEFKEESE